MGKTLESYSQAANVSARLTWFIAATYVSVSLVMLLTLYANFLMELLRGYNPWMLLTE